MEKRSLRLCVTFLEQIAKLTSGVMLEICAEQCNLNDQVEPESCQVYKKKKKSNYLLQIDSAKLHIQI